MPTPIGHSLAGATLYLSLTRAERPLADWRTGVLCVASASAADLDFLAGAALGEWSRFHQGVSHSLVMALGFGLLMACLPLSSLGPWPRRWGTFSALYLSHLALDLITQDTRPPYGILLLWPFLPTSIHAPLRLFPAVRRESLKVILSPWNWRGILVEFVVLAPLLALVARHRSRSRRPSHLRRDRPGAP